MHYINDIFFLNFRIFNSHEKPYKFHRKLKKKKGRSILSWNQRVRNVTYRDFNLFCLLICYDSSLGHYLNITYVYLSKLHVVPFS